MLYKIYLLAAKISSNRDVTSVAMVHYILFLIYIYTPYTCCGHYQFIQGVYICRGDAGSALYGTRARSRVFLELGSLIQGDCVQITRVILIEV